jgi:hypothetical protein
MFICSFKPRDLVKRLGLVAFLILVTVLAILFLRQPDKGSAFPSARLSEEHDTHAADNGARIAFLSSFGWEVSAEPLECVSVVIPQQFGDVYRSYNELQTAQGFDLAQYRGKQVTRYTYAVLNYPKQREYIRANLLVLDDEIIAGDICSVYAKNGFMHGLAFPQPAPDEAQE